LKAPAEYDCCNRRRRERTLGFFRDLFGSQRPCDVCQLGKGTWPSSHNAVADWKLRGHGLDANFLVCMPCRLALENSGLMYGSPFLAIAALAKAGIIDRPPAHAYFQHSEWRKACMHVLDTAGVSVPDEFAALEAIKAMEAALFQPGP